MSLAKKIAEIQAPSRRTSTETIANVALLDHCSRGAMFNFGFDDPVVRSVLAAFVGTALLLGLLALFLD